MLETNTFVSIVITTFNENEYLDSLLKDISRQKLNNLELEIILLEAGSYPKQRATQHLGELASHLKFINIPNLSRTKSLNKLFNTAQGELIIRLDGRSHIKPNYIQQIVELSSRTGAENVGGVMAPIGKTPSQKLIADVMKHPFSFGGAKFRSLSYSGLVDSVYLGAFRRHHCKFGYSWFDEVHPGISEDSDLNYRIRKSGGRVYMDSSIVVEYFPRENLKRFFKLCFNFGVGRGLFIWKHRDVAATRQLVPVLAFFLAFGLSVVGFWVPICHQLLLFLVLIYIILLTLSALSLRKTFLFTLKGLVGFLGCHFYYTLGLLVSLHHYLRDIKKYREEYQAEPVLKEDFPE
jgi:glycosyltransferase involved in cell wall biosynthesis